MTDSFRRATSAIVPNSVEFGSEVLVGEIHTGLLQHSAAVTAESATELLALIPQQGVRTWERPIRQAASPAVLTGVDCNLPTSSGARVRCVGTVSSEIWITAGQVLQASTGARIVPAAERRRLPWSYYLTRPGVLETLSPMRPDDVLGEFLQTDSRPPNVLDLAAVTARSMNRVQGSHLLDRQPPFRPARTTLRWSARVATPVTRPDAAAQAEPGHTIRFTIETATLRTVRLEATRELLPHLSGLCQDLARHDWLLTSLIAMLDVARTESRQKSEVVRRLGPAIDHLLHAWMPTAHVADELAPFWHEVDRRAGLNRQWAVAVSRVRDQVALAAAEQLGIGLGSPTTVTLPASVRVPGP